MASDQPLTSPSALITGASSGIGAEFARQLAQQGYRVVLVARRKQRLESLAAELRQKHNVEVQVFPADLSIDSDLERLEQYIVQDEHLELLVNNAGFGTVGNFAGVSPERHPEMLDVHLKATIRLTRAALPGMIARRKGGIINDASLAAFFPLPGSVVYCATKAAQVAFSEALAVELHGTGVSVQALCPGFTYTEFHDAEEYKSVRRSHIPRFMWGTASDVVSASLKTLRKRQVICIPGTLNKILSIFGRNDIFVPFVRLFIRLGTQASLSIRRRDV